MPLCWAELRNSAAQETSRSTSDAWAARERTKTGHARFRIGCGRARIETCARPRGERDGGSGEAALVGRGVPGLAGEPGRALRARRRRAAPHGRREQRPRRHRSQPAHRAAHEDPRRAVRARFTRRRDALAGRARADSADPDVATSICGAARDLQGAILRAANPSLGASLSRCLSLRYDAATSSSREASRGSTSDRTIEAVLPRRAEPAASIFVWTAAMRTAPGSGSTLVDWRAPLVLLPRLWGYLFPSRDLRGRAFRAG